MKRIVLLITLCLLVLRAFGESYFIDSEEVRTLRYLYRRQGLVFPFQGYPIHGSKLLAALERLPPPASGRDQELYDHLMAELVRQQESGLILRGNLSASYEHRVRTSSVLADPGHVKNGIDFQRDFLSFDPILSLGAGIGFFKGLDVAAEVQLRQPWKYPYDYAPVNNFLYPFHGSELDINYDILTRGMLSWNGTYMDIGLGRERVHFGDAPGGSLYPSRLLPFMDGLRMTVPLGPFTLDYMLAAIIPRKSQEEEALGGINSLGIPSSETSKHFGFMLDENPTIILSSTHIFHWNFGKIKVGAGGTVMYARSNNNYNFTDILPISIFHNADSRPNNLNLILDFSWAFYPGWTVSLMGGFDDINASFINVSDSSVPTIPAVILQLEYSLAARPFLADFLFEAGWTHYLWGNYQYDGDPDDGKPWGGVYLARAIYRYSTFNHSVLLPLTSPYGPGVTWGRLKGDFSFSRLPLKAGADLLVLAKRQNVNLVTTPYRKNSGDEQGSWMWYISLDIPCTYTWRKVDFKFIPSLILRNGDAAFELTLGGQIHLEGEKRSKS